MKKNRDILIETINKAVMEAIIENTKPQNNELDVIIENVVTKQIQTLKEAGEGKSIANKKRSVIQWLKKPEIDTAEIRRKVEGEPETQEEEDSKRSYFMKKVNQTYGKDFTDKEVNDLYNLKSGLGQ